MEPDREQAYQRRIATLEAQLAAALRRLAEIEAGVARLKKNSFNSSKPPSSDIVKPPGPPTPKGGGKVRRTKEIAQVLQQLELVEQAWSDAQRGAEPGEAFQGTWSGVLPLRDHAGD